MEMDQEKGTITYDFASFHLSVLKGDSMIEIRAVVLAKESLLHTLSKPSSSDAPP